MIEANRKLPGPLQGLQNHAIRTLPIKDQRLRPQRLGEGYHVLALHLLGAKLRGELDEARKLIDVTPHHDEIEPDFRKDPSRCPLVFVEVADVGHNSLEIAANADPVVDGGACHINGEFDAPPAQVDASLRASPVEMKAAGCEADVAQAVTERQLDCVE